jgi:hypothetical protein
MNDKHNRRLLQGKASSQFVWRNQIWTVDAAQKLLTTDELERSQNEALGETRLSYPPCILLRLTNCQTCLRPKLHSA